MDAIFGLAIAIAGAAAGASEARAGAPIADDVWVNEQIDAANGFFAPGLADERLIDRLVSSVALPVNIIALPGAPPKQRLAELGVARISYGPVPWRRMAVWLENEARAAISG